MTNTPPKFTRILLQRVNWRASMLVCQRDMARANQAL